MNINFDKDGYFVLKGFFEPAELEGLTSALRDFHDKWKQSNAEFYASKAVNSAYITGTKHLDETKRQQLFSIIGSHKIMNVVSALMPEGSAFMNTQLFFNPVNSDQKNYWHRDPQYHLSVEEQQAALNGPEVLHCRIPLADEPGIELIPGSHKSWDSEEELEVRLEQNGRMNSENLSSGITVPLAAGDLLVFSANMIHRGLYGKHRFAFDILFCDPDPELTRFVDDDCLPDKGSLAAIENPCAFNNTIHLKNSSTTSTE
ncbi:phytanoyl-CoA dioxygenase family protein [Amphritea sp. HPY]|uniref:phytanoyl-CoA dioxygenase family protein n=1 Tax=Amphritea sp. HPY TaxID=3421652 RepID=UPI003D7E1C3E